MIEKLINFILCLSLTMVTFIIVTLGVPSDSETFHVRAFLGSFLLFLVFLLAQGEIEKPKGKDEVFWMWKFLAICSAWLFIYNMLN